MVDKTQRAHAANNLLESSVMMEALTTIQDAYIKQLLTAKTPEEREIHYQEWHGMDRAKKKLAVWASSVRHVKET